MHTTTNILGVVLCGGQSTRMGSDKGLLKQNEFTWSELAFQKLKTLNIPVAVSINPSQENDYQKIFSPEQLIIDQALPNIGGPLLGLLNVHQKFPSHDLLVLACDMINMKTEVLQHLISQHSSGITIFKNEKFPEPLCGIYSSEALKKISSLPLQKSSMMYILEISQTKTIEIKEKWKEYFENKNTMN